MSRYAHTERQSLADLMNTLGPDAPTLNEGWLARDLAAHLVVRERRPDAAGGILLPFLRGYGERVRLRIAGRPWPELVHLVRHPPVWSPVSNPLTDELINTMEFFVHHEDVRRAQPEWQPRELPSGLHLALWRRIGTLARLSLRRFPARLLVQAPGYGEFSCGRGSESLRLIGIPGELVIFLTGRQRASRVQIDGPDEAAARLRTAGLGF